MAIPAPYQARATYVKRPGVVAFSATLIGFLVIGRLGFGGRHVLLASVSAILVVLSAIDLHRRILPNVIVIPSIAVVIAAQTAIQPDRAWIYLACATGATAGFLVLALASRGGVGMGDVKLAALLGAALGSTVVTALLIGSLLGAAFSIYLLASRGAAARKATVAYGPFMAAGAIIAILLA
jgi:leader peptidase (prepilin peptidase)/N-methyltransferase